ncbi:nuclear transport factor 2 family protein [Litoreibacter roseus]|uniref:SnoaL-like domain-containing protein n=1 Tax=Litoreibacter roseus TaxID=2601869 RepID=A0A6N6JK98_9RHOB|nr:nuclear transport factor 2 family protein [Litoreibacter roseus]GFE66751.1 hypothetical protein KIN_38250 [Litoreibacter roseus]
MNRIATLVAASMLPTFVAAQQAPIAEPASSTETKLQNLLDREEIRQVITNYGLAFDMQDWDLHRSVFTDEIQMDFTASLGGGLQTMAADGWVSAVKPFFGDC